jgi:hypothetical protein
MNFPAIFGMDEGTLFIDPYPIVLPGKVHYQRIQRGLHVVQPLFIAFFYKGLAHKQISEKIMPRPQAF